MYFLSSRMHLDNSQMHWSHNILKSHSLSIQSIMFGELKGKNKQNNKKTYGWLFHILPGMALPSSKYFRTDSLRKLVCRSNGIDSASTASSCCFTSFFILKSDDRVTLPRFERILSTCFDSVGIKLRVNLHNSLSLNNSIFIWLSCFFLVWMWCASLCRKWQFIKFYGTYMENSVLKSSV